jgi:PAS domain S-box-containing protein
MSGNSGLIWGVVVITAALLTLSAAIVISLLVGGRKMKESEKRFHLLFERAFDAIILTDESGIIVDTNEATSRLLGYAKEELLGKPIVNLLSDDDISRFQIAMKKALSKDNEMAGELVLRGKSDEVRHAEGVVGHFAFLESHYLIASFRDLTERLEAAEALKAERQVLYEKNVALREVLQHIEQEKTDIKLAVAEKLEQVIIPLLKKTIAVRGVTNENYHRLLIDELNKLSGFTGASPSLYYKLSPREIEICDLIRTGASTKDIAKSLNISVSTVNKHRERIRSRLDISHKEVNLTAYLQKKAVGND